MKKVIYISQHQRIIIDEIWDCPFFNEFGYCRLDALKKREVIRNCDENENNKFPDWCPLETA